MAAHCVVRSGFYRSLAVIACCGMATSGTVALAAVEVTIDSSAMTNGYMSVFDLPSSGGSYQFGSGWGIADLNATFPNSSTVNFTPNSISDPNPYWYTPSGGPGSTGNKIMEANLYSQPADGTYAGQTINFAGNVSAFTLQTGTNPNTDYAFKAFIRDFAPDYSSMVEQSAPISATGAFLVTLTAINDPARHVQYGLQMKGPCVWVTDAAAKGGVTVTAVPEPSTCAMGAVGLLVAGVLRRRQGGR